MRILQLCKKFPYPPKDGEAIAILNLTRSLSKLGHEVTVLALNTKKHYFDIKLLPESVKQLATFHSVDIDTDLKALDAFKNLFSGSSYHIDRFISVRFKAKLVELLTENNFDVIHLETIYLGPYVELIRRHSKATLSLRAHNVEHEIWERLADNQKPGLKKIYLRLLAKRLKKYELNSMHAYDLLVPISTKDQAAFKSFGWKKNSFVLPTGIDLDTIQDKGLEYDHHSVFFIGGLDWLPNLEGVQWFLDKVWTALYPSHPQMKFYLAGRNMPEWMQKLKVDGLSVMGEVDDAHEFMSGNAIMIVPLFSGSGMRIKIIEAMALGKAIVSTTIGAEGIGYEDGKHLHIADDAETFLHKIQELMKHPSMISEMGKNARKLIESKYNNLELTKELIQFYAKHLKE